VFPLQRTGLPAWLILDLAFVSFWGGETPSTSNLRIEISRARCSIMEGFSFIASSPAPAADEFKSIWLALAEIARSEEAEAAGASSHGYQSELATPELVVELRRLLAAERHTGRLVCRYLADLADRIHGGHDRELCAYVDEFHAAACFFDLGTREVRERVRIGRALRRLPQIEVAFVAGELSYSRVREITRVAQVDTQSEWLERARKLDMRSLERRVAREAPQCAVAPGRFDATTGDTPDRARLPTAGLPAEVPSSGVPNEQTSRSTRRELARLHAQWLDRDSMRVTFELSADAWALVERALEGARQKAATFLGDADALAAVARDALAAQNQSGDASDPRCAVVVYECRRCAQSGLDTGVGLFELEPAAATTLACGAREIDLASEGRSVQRGGPLPAAIRRAVLLRDHCRCRVPGCNRRRYVDVHHLIARSNGGEHSRSNCITLCSTHHRRLHEGQLLIIGNADAQPHFYDAALQPLATFDDARSSPASRQARQNPEPAEAIDARATQLGILSEPAVRLLEIMGRQGNWTPNDLLEKSALEPAELQHALLLLELEGRVRRRGYEIDPV
jgi:hypothetical protein